MSNKFLDQNGLLYLWGKIKAADDKKVDKVEGKGLSTNDFTTELKTKLEGIATGATNVTVENSLTSTSTANALAAAQGKVLDEQIKALSDSMGELGYGDMLKATYDADNDGKVDQALHAEEADHATNADSATKAGDADKLGGQLPTYYAKASDIPTVPTNVSAFTNDAGYLTQHQDISGKLDKTGDGSNVTATFTVAGERANIATGEKLSTILGKIAKYFTDLKTVAFTGSYNDLKDLPAIPTVTNDLTNELKAQYDAAYAHSQTAHAPANAQANVIEGIKVNGAAVTLTDKVASITIPTTVAALSDAGNYALKSDIVNVYKYQGSVGTVAELPSTGMEVGHVYNVEERGVNYAWNGTEWDALGELFSVTAISNSEIDTICV